MPSALGLVYCAEGGHWIFEWNVHSLSYFIEYGQISKWEKHWGLWTNQRKTETNCNILHIYESWHVHDSSHIVFGLSKPCQDILKKNHHQGGFPCPAPSEWVEVKKPGMEEPVGEMEERGEMEEMEERGALKPVFREAGVQLLRILQQSRCPLFGHLMLWREVLHW